MILIQLDWLVASTGCCFFDNSQFFNSSWVCRLQMEAWTEIEKVEHVIILCFFKDLRY